MALACGGTEIEPETPASTNEVVAPSGERGQVVPCGSMTECYAKAAERCPGGYVEHPIVAVGSHGKAGAVAISKDVAIATGKTDTDFEMLVECKRVAAEDDSTKTIEAGALGAQCERADNCVRLRVRLRAANASAEALCVSAIDGVKRCTFRCADDQLADGCRKLGRQCIATGADAGDTTCQMGE